MKALTTETDPAKASTPFDLNRGGFVLGEGSAVLVLEEYEHAKARGAKIYCELAGYGATCDAYHMTAPADECGASSKAMIEAYTEAGLKPEDITYINAHGTSTHLNDMLETKAVKIALGEEQARKVKINTDHFYRMGRIAGEQCGAFRAGQEAAGGDFCRNVETHGSAVGGTAVRMLFGVCGVRLHQQRTHRCHDRRRSGSLSEKRLRLSDRHWRRQSAGCHESHCRRHDQFCTPCILYGKGDQRSTPVYGGDPHHSRNRF